ncbi:unnamed protein product [Aspergillus oryzae]|uniref:Unnamed protein product n=2 Tax=Aspergillus oryzae TaxID=5062 RepID=A0AAN4YV68_ASPOZ|nr:unnamed protein product [Aspergillus oryzae]GMF92999.1 unnamed protein product [Aspergillus oryzae]GMG15568.1 unnamed protein product [Aspergillus oryzae]GMG35887.1 unnamed protein product [Aspergillus oryzae]GMG41094.1 unnamed protein product [Aspergillus oryzae var. brunneus]
MSSIAAMASRRAFARQSVFRAPARRFYSSKLEEASLDKAPRRDPELYKPTSVTSESNVRIGDSAMPWEREDDGKVYKYQYHPHGDKSQPLRNAPSALNTVIVPNVTLPARYNKYGKEEWDY